MQRAEEVQLAYFHAGGDPSILKWIPSVCNQRGAKGKRGAFNRQLCAFLKLNITSVVAHSRASDSFILICNSSVDKKHNAKGTIYTPRKALDLSTSFLLSRYQGQEGNCRMVLFCDAEPEDASTKAGEKDIHVPLIRQHPSQRLVDTRCFFFIYLSIFFSILLGLILTYYLLPNVILFRSDGLRCSFVLFRFWPWAAFSDVVIIKKNRRWAALLSGEKYEDGHCDVT